MPEFSIAAQPNDAFFKEAFSSIELSTVFFRDHLPSSVAAQIDWSTLTLQPASFVESTLQQTHSDLLFSARMDGRETLLYLIFEHQTTVDQLMPLRLLGYMIEILRNHERQHGLPLPPVLPFVLHQGPDRWTVSQDFSDLFELPEALSELLLPYVPKFRHELLDLTLHQPANQERDGRLRVVLELMKAARAKRLREFFRWLSEEDLRGDLMLAEHLITVCLLYAMYADSSLDPEEIVHTFSNNPNLQPHTMSIAQKLIDRGISQGISQGVSQGEWIGKLHLLEEMLGLDKTPSAQLVALDLAELEGRFVALQQEYNRRFKRS